MIKLILASPYKPKNNNCNYGQNGGRIAKSFNRTDLHIEPFLEINEINRTLSTVFPDENSTLWSQAGYVEPPTISEMVQNYAHWVS